MIAHIALLHMSMETHAQDPYSEFHSVAFRAQRLLWSLPPVGPWVEFRHRYKYFMVSGNPGVDGPRFQAHGGAWTTLSAELLLREEFDQRGLTMETLQHVFPLHQAHPPPVVPPPAQEPPIPPVPGTPLMPESPGEAYEVINIPDTPDLVVISSTEDHQDEEDDPEEDPKEDDPEEDDPEEDQGTGEMAIDQSGEQEEEELMVEDEQEPQVQPEVGDAESVASSSSFDSGEEPDDESDPDYDPARDR